MNKSTAARILRIDANDFDREAARDKLEDQVFELVTYFARRSFLPQLASAKMRRLMELAEIETVLDLKGAEPVGGPSPPEKAPEKTLSISDADHLGLLIRSYHRSEAFLKMNLANTLSPTEAMRLYAQWVDLFQAYALRYIPLYAASAFAKLPEDVKISVQIDAAQLVAELNHETDPRSVIHLEYSRLCKIFPNAS